MCPSAAASDDSRHSVQMKHIRRPRPLPLAPPTLLFHLLAKARAEDDVMLVVCVVFAAGIKYLTWKVVFSASSEMVLV